MITATLLQGKYHVKILTSCLLLVVTEKHFSGVINLMFLCTELLLSKVEPGFDILNALS
jgi:hypothetical protein